jgi:hypothetical protein
MDTGIRESPEAALRTHHLSSRDRWCHTSAFLLMNSSCAARYVSGTPVVFVPFSWSTIYGAVIRITTEHVVAATYRRGLSVGWPLRARDTLLVVGVERRRERDPVVDHHLARLRCGVARAVDVRDLGGMCDYGFVSEAFYVDGRGN